MRGLQRTHMRGFCGQRKTDAYAWSAADAKFKKKKLN